jgi:hypothetical protein
VGHYIGGDKVLEAMAERLEFVRTYVREGQLRRALFPITLVAILRAINWCDEDISTKSCSYYIKWGPQHACDLGTLLLMYADMYADVGHSPNTYRPSKWLLGQFTTEFEKYLRLPKGRVTVLCQQLENINPPLAPDAKMILFEVMNRLGTIFGIAATLSLISKVVTGKVTH